MFALRYADNEGAGPVPFADGLQLAFWLAVIASLLAVAASWFGCSGAAQRVWRTGARVEPGPVLIGRQACPHLQ